MALTVPDSGPSPFGVVLRQDDAKTAERIMRYALYNETQVEKKHRKRRVRGPGEGEDSESDGDNDDDQGGDEGEGDDAATGAKRQTPKRAAKAASEAAAKRARSDPFDFGSDDEEGGEPSSSRKGRRSAGATTAPSTPAPAGSAGAAGSATKSPTPARPTMTPERYGHHRLTPGGEQTRRWTNVRQRPLYGVAA